MSPHDAPPCADGARDHNARRRVWIEIAVVYAVVVAALAWNWLA